MPYTVRQLATLAGVTPRTLRYYDKVGLLSPSALRRNGYREYGEKEMVRLQQILFFRELEFPLADIRRMMDRPGFDAAAALQDQKKLLQLKRARLGRLIHSIEKTITSMHDDQKQDGAEMYDALKDDDVKQYQDEVRQRWGNTDAYKQSQMRVGKMTKTEVDKLKEDGKKFTQKLADHMHLDPASDEAQVLIAEHFKGINAFYDCSIAMYRSLGQMYLDDPRFTAHYDAFAPGLAAWLQRGIARFCDLREKKG